MLQAVMAVVSETNRYFAAQEPWVLRKTDPARMGTVLYVTAEVVRRFAILPQPVMPESCEKLLDVLSVPSEARSFVELAQGRVLEPGRELPAPTGVFPRFVEPEATPA